MKVLCQYRFDSPDEHCMAWVMLESRGPHRLTDEFTFEMQRRAAEWDRRFANFPRLSSLSWRRPTGAKMTGQYVAENPVAYEAMHEGAAVIPLFA